MRRMFSRRIVQSLLIPSLLMAAICGGCRKTANPPANSATPPAGTTTSASAQTHAIETEVVAPQPIAGIIRATGKILVSENRVAVIGPVHEGRLVALYAGQGSRVAKGQKLADLKSADI